MSAPQGGYPPQDGYGQPAGYGSPVQQPSETPPASAFPQAQPGSKKKRAYAGEAFEFGSGANAALGGQLPAGGAYAQQPQAQAYQQPMYGADPSQVPAAAPGYSPVAPPVSQMTQQFGAMGMADPGQMPQQPAQVPRPVPLNQLYPTDLLTQPFNVAELDYPPPPIILPPGVCPTAVIGKALLTSLDQRLPLSPRQLPFEVCTLYVERRPDYALPPEEVQASFRPRHPAIWRAARLGRPGSSYSRPGDLAVQTLPVVYQSVCDLPRSRTSLALQHVQFDQ